MRESIINLSSYNHLPLAHLENLPTIESGHFDNLKIDERGPVAGIPVRAHVRVWLSRCGVADGLPYDNQVTVERRIIPTGTWKTVCRYQALGFKEV